MMRRAAVRALNRGGRQIAVWARKEAPLGLPRKDREGHPGKLRKSIRWDRATQAHLWVNISANTDYAADQHEKIHYKHPRGGKALYLRDPLIAYATVITHGVAHELDIEVSKWNAEHAARPG
jgi:hypothetical protein